MSSGQSGNKLFFGDNLPVLRDRIQPESVDLVKLTHYPKPRGSMRTLIAALFFCLSVPSSVVQAQTVNLRPVPVDGAVIDDRYPHLRLPEAYATARAWPRTVGISHGQVIASWYDCKKPGECSRSKRTASGEKFNPGALTCAHRSLPFGTRLRVSHAGRSVVCRVNDRGPFIKGRSLDLSAASARAIGMSGVGRVMIERL